MKQNKKNNYKNNIEKLYIEKQFEKIKHIKADPNDIFLNAAAIQEQMLIDLGIKKKKFKKIKENKKVNNNINNTNNVSVIPSLLPKIMNNKNYKMEKESEVIKRRKFFLDNLTLAEKIGLKEIKKMPLSLVEWRQIEKKAEKREDYKNSCPICLESLFTKDSLILSCSHIFHKVK
jgi:hypothetical protein